MSLIAAILIITSAFMHAGWNFVSKRRSPSLAFFYITAVSASFLMIPVLILYRHALPFVPTSVWGLVVLTGIAQGIYLFGLAGAYKRGDISLAYPLARALPVLFVAAISFLLGRGDQIGRLGLVGMGLIIVGCIILPLIHFKRTPWRDYFNLVYLMALIAAIGTTSYTLIDDQALRQLRNTASIQLSTSEITLLFVAFQTTSTAVMLGIATSLYPAERQKLRSIMRDRSLLITGVLTGVAIMSTYGLVLAAMAYVTNVSYVAAFRQLSIPIGAILGMTLQKESRHRPKLIGIAIVSLGLILVGFG